MMKKENKNTIWHGKRKAFWNVCMTFLLLLLLHVTIIPVAAAVTPGNTTLTSVSSVNGVSVEINWKKAANASTYRVYYKERGKSWNRIGVVSSGTTKFVHKSSAKYPLIPGKVYYYTVRAVSKDNVAGPYNTTGLLTSVVAQTNIKTATEKAAKQVTITWTNAKGANSYRVYYKKKGDTAWTRIATLGLGVTSYVHKSSAAYPLYSGQDYVYTVRAANTYTSALASYDKEGKTLKIKTIPTVTLSTLDWDASAKKANLTWKAVSGFDYYNVYRKEEGESWKRISTVKGTSYSDGSIPNVRDTFYYTVRAIDTITKDQGGYDKTGLKVTIDNTGKPLGLTLKSGYGTYTFDKASPTHASLTVIDSMNKSTVIEWDVPTEEDIYNKWENLMITFPEGTPYTNANYYSNKLTDTRGNVLKDSTGSVLRSGIVSGYGCAGYAAMASDFLFGTYAPVNRHTHFDQLRIGDVCRNKTDTHSVVYMGIEEYEGEYWVRIANGNMNASIMYVWMRLDVFRSEYSGGCSYYTTRYFETQNLSW